MDSDQQQHKPVTRQGNVVIFNSTNWTPTVGEEDSPGKSLIQQAGPCIDKNLISVIIIQIIPSNPIYASTFATTEATAASKLEEYIINAPKPQEESLLPHSGTNTPERIWKQL